MDYITGCTHFGHANIIKYCNRPFASVEEMDEAMIARWNLVVGKQDTVYHLGDFAWRRHSSYRERLNGKIVFIKGNHDHDLPYPSKPYLELATPSGSPFRMVVLFHYPIDSWNGRYHGVPHFHCHTHSHEAKTGERRRSVTVEAHDYRPVSLWELVYRTNLDPVPR